MDEVNTGKAADALDRRPQLATAHDRAKAFRCPVVVSKLDRLSRDVAFVSSLMARKVGFIGAELGPEIGRLMLHIYAASPRKNQGGLTGEKGAGRTPRQPAPGRGAIKGPRFDQSRSRRLRRQRATDHHEPRPHVGQRHGARAQRSPDRDRERRPMERNDRVAGTDAGLRPKREPRKSAAFLTGGRLPGRLPSTVIANPGRNAVPCYKK